MCSDGLGEWGKRLLEVAGVSFLFVLHNSTIRPISNLRFDLLGVLNSRCDDILGFCM